MRPRESAPQEPTVPPVQNNNPAHSDTASYPPFGLVDLAMLGVVFIWGINFPVVKYALNEMRPLTFNGLRFALASALTLILVVSMKKDLRVEPHDWGRIILIAIIGNTLYQILFIKGLAITKAGNSSLLIATNPIFIALVSAFLRLERITKRMWIGILLSFLGIIVVVASSGKELGLDLAALPGDLMTLLAAICWAIYAVLSRPLLPRYPPLKLAALTMATSTPFLLLAAIPDLLAQDWGAITWRGWLGLGYSFVLAISIAYIVYYQAVLVVGNARTGIYGNLVPVIALVTAAITLHEALTPLQVTGAVVILVGIYLTRSGGKR